MRISSSYVLNSKTISQIERDFSYSYVEKVKERVEQIMTKLDWDDLYTIALFHKNIEKLAHTQIGIGTIPTILLSLYLLLFNSNNEKEVLVWLTPLLVVWMYVNMLFFLSDSSPAKKELTRLKAFTLPLYAKIGIYNHENFFLHDAKYICSELNLASSTLPKSL